MLRSCYRSYWSLHENPAILSPGRYYFTDADFAPFPTLLGSRNWDKDDYPAARVRIWGEWDGKQKWDAGAKPAQVPEPRRIGSLDCLANGATSADVAPGNPVSGPFRTVCIGGVVYSFPNTITVGFNVSYQNRDFTYYDNVELTLVETDCEARYEGESGLPNTTAILRVTEGGGGLQTNFYLCEHIGPPVATACCSTALIPRELVLADLLIQGFGGPPDFINWELEAADIPLKYNAGIPPGFPDLPPGDGWWGLVKCDGTPGTALDFGYAVWWGCTGVPGFERWFLYVYLADGRLAFLRRDDAATIAVCSPFHWLAGLLATERHNGPICGNDVVSSSVEMAFDISE